MVEQIYGFFQDVEDANYSKSQQNQIMGWFQEPNQLPSQKIGQYQIYRSKLLYPGPINYENQENCQQFSSQNKYMCQYNNVSQQQKQLLENGTVKNNKKNGIGNEETDIPQTQIQSKTQTELQQKIQTRKQLFEYKKRQPVLKIQYNSFIEKSYLNSSKRQKTVALPKNYKRLILGVCEKIKSQNPFDKQSAQLIKKYKRRKSNNFQSTKQFFGLYIQKGQNQIVLKEKSASDLLRKQIFKEFSGGNLIRQILLTKSKIRNKLTMIYFLDKLNLSITKPEKHNRWKY